MIVALLLAAATPAKLVIVGGTGNTVITYPTMARCLAAKKIFDQQQEAEYRRALARGFMRAPLASYCLPGK